VAIEKCIKMTQADSRKFCFQHNSQGLLQIRENLPEYAEVEPHAEIMSIQSPGSGAAMNLTENYQYCQA
jgi:hypothetical protein